MSTFGSFDSYEFMGKNGFIWWIGVVEKSSVDPLKAGRSKVRIFGFHHEDDTIQPTEDLPWALALTSLAYPDSPPSPPPGTWVLGFFLDGLLAQQPVMIGALAGYRNREPETNPNTPVIE